MNKQIDKDKMETFATSFHHGLFGRWMDKSTIQNVLEGIDEIDKVMDVQISALIDLKRSIGIGNDDKLIEQINTQIFQINEAIKFIKHSYNACGTFTKEEQYAYDNQPDID